MQQLLSFVLICGGMSLILSDRRTYRRWGKRFLDLVLGTILLVASLPIIILVAFVALYDVGWPIFFHQNRYGKDCRIFRMYKFRTLQGKAIEGWAPYDICEARASRIGKFLRHHCLDELLQFFHVVGGSMSIVGPRPITPGYASSHSISNATLRHMFATKPGLTGFIQMATHKRDCDAEQKVIELDIAYIEQYSFWVDIKLIFQTVFVVFRGR